MRYEDFHKANVRRCEYGFGHKFTAEGDAKWSVADWVTAVAGEFGELCNLLKKRRRGEDIPQQEIEDEFADTLTYLDLLAEALDIDVLGVTRNKFNRVSERIGWFEKL
jgi:NTP pyrophosphatase (non-canonical NTP hydrolase)